MNSEDYIEDYTESILESIRNIAHFSIDLKDLNDIIAGESTRVMNIYSRFIGGQYEHNNDRKIYDKAKFVML